MNGKNELAEISANQLYTIVLKACVGAGVARGVAEDVADGCLMLANAKLDFMPELLNLIDVFESAGQTAPWNYNEDGWSAQAIRVLCDGPSAVDLAHAGEQVKSISDSSTLLLGLILARQAEYDIAFEIRFEDDWVAAQNVGELSPDTGKFALRLSQKKKTQSSNLDVRPEFSLTDWQRLKTFAEEILVPADDINSADAGAGLTDND